MARLLFGLGNPGPRYAATRHNVGWQVLETLAKAEGAAFRATRLFDGEEASFHDRGEVVRLVRPTSFMNLCGPVYARALEVYDLTPVAGLVVLDDFMLPFGRLRFRDSGSSGGHNGLKSIEDALSGKDLVGSAYPRLRVGIGPVPPPRDPADFVLEGYGAEERRTLAEVLGRAADGCRTWLSQGLAAAMNRFNAPAPEPPAETGGGKRPA